VAAMFMLTAGLYFVGNNNRNSWYSTVQYNDLLGDLFVLSCSGGFCFSVQLSVALFVCAVLQWGGSVSLFSCQWHCLFVLSCSGRVLFQCSAVSGTVCLCCLAVGGFCFSVQLSVALFVSLSLSTFLFL
jgi:hypothetical protein